jgi:hypothetical protein
MFVTDDWGVNHVSMAAIKLARPTLPICALTGGDIGALHEQVRLL